MPGGHDNLAKGTEAATAKRAMQADMDERIVSSSYIERLEILADEAAKAAHRMYARANATGRGDTKLMMEASRELRQLLESIEQHRRAAGDMADADRFFATLASRLETATPVLEACARPIARVGDPRPGPVLANAGDVG